MKIRGENLINQINNTKIVEGSIAIWNLGQESIVVKSNEYICYFDPYLSNYIDEVYGNAPRNFDSPVKPEEVTNADFVFISHDHMDHMDPYTLKGISNSSKKSKFICPQPHINKLTKIGIELDRIIPAKANHSIKLKDMSINPIAEKHEEYYIDKEGNHGNLGYIINFAGTFFYHAGDVIADKQLVEDLKLYNIDIGCLPINGRDFRRFDNDILGNMNYREAIELADLVGIDTIIPMHYDLFKFNSENPSYFVDYIYNNNYNIKFKFMRVGERMIYMNERI